jgi:16S rRNA processing protein RimM
MENSKDFITIGKITKPLGVKGKVKVIPLTDFPEKFKERKRVFLFDESRNEFFINKVTNSFEFVIEEAEIDNGQIGLTFKYISDKDSSDLLKNLLIQVKEDERADLPAGKYYLYELTGCILYDKGSLVGEVIDIENFGSDDLFLIEHENKKIYIPFRQEFIKNIDIKNKRIDADLIEGFLE